MAAYGSGFPGSAVSSLRKIKACSPTPVLFEAVRFRWQRAACERDSQHRFKASVDRTYSHTRSISRSCVLCLCVRWFSDRYTFCFEQMCLPFNLAPLLPFLSLPFNLAPLHAAFFPRDHRFTHQLALPLPLICTMRRSLIRPHNLRPSPLHLVTSRSTPLYLNYTSFDTSFYSTFYLTIVSWLRRHDTTGSLRLDVQRCRRCRPSGCTRHGC